MKSTQLKKDDIESLEIRDFKSIGPAQRVAFGALTVLAGANSTGKSTLMQPILLLKQTLDSSFDPGPLRLDGPNLNVSSTAQLISKVPGARTDGFEFTFDLAGGGYFRVRFSYNEAQGLDVESTVSQLSGLPAYFLRRGMTKEQLRTEALHIGHVRFPEEIPKVSLVRDRCFLDLEVWWPAGDLAQSFFLSQIVDHTAPIGRLVSRFMHLPGLRGPSERTYQVSGNSTVFAGTFENYTASVIHRWQTSNDKAKLEQLFKHLMDLGLTWKVSAVPIGDTRIELRVGRLTRLVRGGARDLISIADVGVGVSEALPILVALVAAEPGDWIYVEQPETHLHPRAQASLGALFAKAALRGVRVVVETHSSVLLRSIQTLVAKDEIDKNLVKLHWCTRDPKTGATNVQLADLKNDGSFGEWPEDFADVELEVEQEYLDAASARHR